MTLVPNSNDLEGPNSVNLKNLTEEALMSPIHDSDSEDSGMEYQNIQNNNGDGTTSNGNIQNMSQEYIAQVIGGQTAKNIPENLPEQKNTKETPTSYSLDNSGIKKRKISDLNDSNSSVNTNKSQNLSSSPKKVNYPSVYTDNCHGPFKIFIQPISPVVNTNNKPKFLDPIEVAQIIVPISKNNIESISSAGFNKVKVIYKNRYSANAVLSNLTLHEKNLKAFIPHSCVSRQFIIKGIPTSLSEEEILENLEVLSPFYRENMNIINIRRFNRKAMDEGNNLVSVPSRTVLVTVEGQVLPQSVYLFKVPYDIYFYKPQVRQCYNCLNFGHVSKNCKSYKKCVRCGNKDHDNNPCPLGEQVICHFCKDGHLPTSKNCPHYIKEQEILNEATERNMTLSEYKTAVKQEKRRKANQQFRFSEFPQFVEDDIVVNNEMENEQEISYAKALSQPRKNSPKQQSHRIKSTKHGFNNNDDEFDIISTTSQLSQDSAINKQAFSQSQRPIRPRISRPVFSQTTRNYNAYIAPTTTSTNTNINDICETLSKLNQSDLEKILARFTNSKENHLKNSPDNNKSSS